MPHADLTGGLPPNLLQSLSRGQRGRAEENTWFWSLLTFMGHRVSAAESTALAAGAQPRGWEIQVLQRRVSGGRLSPAVTAKGLTFCDENTSIIPTALGRQEELAPRLGRGRGLQPPPSPKAANCLGGKKKCKKLFRMANQQISLDCYPGL